MATIKKDTLHPENEPEVDIYPKTSIDQVENLQANLDALNGDIANANGEIANISDNVQTIANRVEIAENSITVLTTAYESYTDYTEVTNGFLLTYLSGRQIELPIKAGTNVTFSKYPGSNQIIINFTGGSVPDNIALLDANNTFSGSNTFSKLTYFNNQIALDINPISFNDDTKNMSLVFNYNGFIKRFVDTGNVYSINIPNKTGTIALTTDIPTLADYPTTIFFNNYKAGIGYKDTSTGTTKTVVSTDNNGAQIVIGDSNTGLTLATNARPKVLEDSTVKEVAYVSDFESKLDKTGGTISGTLIITGTTNANIYQVKGSKILDYNSSTTTNEIYGININNIVNNKFEVTKGNIKVSLDMTKVGANDEFALKSNLPNTSLFATFAGNNKWFGDNIFDGFSKVVRVNGLFQVSGDEEDISTTYNQVSYDGLNIAYMDGENQNIFHAGIDYENKARLGFDKYDGTSYNVYIPEKNGIIATIEDIPNYNIVAGVSYDTTNGAVISYTNGKLITIPIKAGDGVTIDADTTNKNILISAPGGGSSTPQYNRGIDSATPTTFTYELGVYHTLTITLLSTYVSTTIIFPNDYDGSSIDIELEGKSFLIMVVAGLLSVRNTTDNTEWVGKLE
jgi:hypothetical protein|nr:MAG TPA: hypothetical protein [Caudoviricetes sp.]